MPLGTYEFDDANQFLQSLRDLIGRRETPRRGRRYIYRGHGDSDWRLQPSAFRSGARFISVFGWETTDEYIKRFEETGRHPLEVMEPLRRRSKPPKFERSLMQRRVELETLMAFFSVADEAGLPLPEDSQVIRAKLEGLYELSRGIEAWPPLEIRSILALAQHHGLPTRLLDWSWDWQVAAFFAAKDSFTRNQTTKARPSAFAVWALDAAWVASELSWEDYQKEHFKDVMPPDETRHRLQLVTAPNAANQNLRAQKGLFTLLEDLRSPETPLEALSDMPHIDLLKFLAPSKIAGDVLSLLARGGVTAAAIYPSYYGVVASLRDQELWKEPK